MRTTKKEVKAVFERFCDVNGYGVAENYNDVGKYELNYASCYGGYVIQKISNEAGGVSQPFGYKRRTAGEFVDCLRFAMDVVYINSKLQA